MKLFFAILIPVLAASAQSQAAKKAAPAATKAASSSNAASSNTASSNSTARKAPANVKDASKPMAIPANAVRDSSGDYHVTDEQGKKWIYRKTPFGVSRLEDTGQPVAAQSRPSSAGGAGIVAIDQGESVHFEKKGPFGTWKWDKKKSELDEGERAALQASQGNRQTAKQE